MRAFIRLTRPIDPQAVATIGENLSACGVDSVLGQFPDVFADMFDELDSDLLERL